MKVNVITYYRAKSFLERINFVIYPDSELQRRAHRDMEKFFSAISVCSAVDYLEIKAVVPAQPDSGVESRLPLANRQYLC